MNTYPVKYPKKIELMSFRLFSEKISMFLKPTKLHQAKLKQANIADKERVNLNSVVVIDMDTAQPLVEAFRHVKLISRRDKSRVSVLVTKVHSEVQAQSIFNKLACLCENFINVELQYLGGVPSESLLKSIDGLRDEEQKKTARPQESFKSRSHLDFIQEYWIQTHPLIQAYPKIAVGQED